MRSHLTCKPSVHHPEYGRWEHLWKGRRAVGLFNCSFACDLCASHSSIECAEYLLALPCTALQVVTGKGRAKAGEKKWDCMLQERELITLLITLSILIIWAVKLSNCKKLVGPPFGPNLSYISVVQKSEIKTTSGAMYGFPFAMEIVRFFKN